MKHRVAAVIAPLDVDEFASLVGLCTSVASDDGAELLRKPSEYGLTIVDEERGSADVVVFEDTPETRALFAVKQHCRENSYKYKSAMMRNWAFADGVGRLSEEDWVKSLGESELTSVLDACTEIAATLPLNRRLLFSKRDFRRELKTRLTSGFQSRLRLPHADRATVANEKVTDYLLSRTHPRGREKAAFFARFGFQLTDWQALAGALAKHAQTADVFEEIRTPRGTKFLLEGPIRSPDGRDPLLRSIWYIDTKAEVPRFVSAYPLRKGRKA
jgi:hypothetical protein